MEVCGVDWYKFKNEQANLYQSSNSSVGMVSDMIYGSQWDAIMNWMNQVPNDDPSIEETDKKFYIKNSIGMGNYNGSAIQTGSKDDYKVKNIYDLAGNYLEWTQELNSYHYRVYRGNYFGNNGNNGSNRASSRNWGYPPQDLGVDSSRLQLYIK